MSLFTRRSRQPWVWLTGALCLLGLAGAAPEAGAQGAVSRVVVNPTSATLIAGQSVDLAAQAVDRRGNEVPDVAFTFTSSRPGTAGVNPLGPAQARVTGVAAGTARITVRGGGKTANVEITVIAN
ncbi:MAG: hypothetical protein FJX77_13425, partial [Armatimonadetes bacterium]|nr:hypothetical protein [Armatimonadota bacterium]